MCVSFISFVAYSISWIIASYGYALFNGGHYDPKFDDVIYILKLTFITSSIMTVIAWIKVSRI